MFAVIVACIVAGSVLAAPAIALKRALQAAHNRAKAGL